MSWPKWAAREGRLPREKEYVNDGLPWTLHAWFVLIPPQTHPFKTKTAAQLATIPSFPLHDPWSSAFWHLAEVCIWNWGHM